LAIAGSYSGIFCLLLVAAVLQGFPRESSAGCHDKWQRVRRRAHHGVGFQEGAARLWHEAADALLQNEGFRAAGQAAKAGMASIMSPITKAIYWIY
jgi:hypothetical protein